MPDCHTWGMNISVWEKYHLLREPNYNWRPDTTTANLVGIYSEVILIEHQVSRTGLEIEKEKSLETYI